LTAQSDRCQLSGVGPLSRLRLERCKPFISYYTTYVPIYRSSYFCSRPCTFVKSVALSSALAPPGPLARIISYFFLPLTLHHPRHLAMDQKAALEALEANIVELCTNHEEEHWCEDDYRRSVSIGTDYFVKFGDSDVLWPELQTQLYIFEYARSNPHPDAPRIPKVVHHFSGGRTMHFMHLVMEFITLTEASIDQTAQALVWLSSVPPPPNHVMGPLGGDIIHHRFFQDYEAPLRFSSVMALQRYMYKVCREFIFSCIQCSLNIWTRRTRGSRTEGGRCLQSR
jgi:hypothetical protein